jgi:hypothetical protein
MTHTAWQQGAAFAPCVWACPPKASPIRDPFAQRAGKRPIQSL